MSETNFLPLREYLLLSKKMIIRYSPIANKILRNNDLFNYVVEQAIWADVKFDKNKGLSAYMFRRNQILYAIKKCNQKMRNKKKVLE